MANTVLDDVLQKEAEKMQMAKEQAMAKNENGQPVEPNQTPNESEAGNEAMTDPNEAYEMGETSNPNMSFDEEQGEPAQPESAENPLEEHGITDPTDLIKIKEVIDTYKNAERNSDGEKDPILKKVIELYKNGRSDLASQYMQGDYDRMLKANPRGVVELYLKNIEGINDPEKVDEMVADYNFNNHKDMSLVKQFADKLSDEHKKTFTDYTPKEVILFESLKGQNEKYNKEIPNLIAGLEGKKINGVTLDGTDIKKIESALKNGLGIFDSKTGAINKDQMLEIAKTLVTHHRAIKNAKTGAEIKAKEDILKTMTNPNPNNSNSNNMPTESKPKSYLESRAEEMGIKKSN